MLKGLTWADPLISENIIRKQIQNFRETDNIAKALNSTNALIVVINEGRNIIFANKAFLEMFNIDFPDKILGLKPGDVAKCIHSEKGILGCGSSANCIHCSALQIMKTSIRSNVKYSGEVVITITKDDKYLPLNLYEYIQPLELNGTVYYVMTFIDISDKIRKRSLEKIFFHDILNSLGALRGLVEELREEISTKEEISSDLESEARLIKDYFDLVLDEIQAQKQLLDAESEELRPVFSVLNSLDILESARQLYSRLEEYKGREIIIYEKAFNISFESDFVLLRRIIINMLKNALEESKDGDKVLIGCSPEPDGSRVVFWVKNNAYIREEVQAKIFERSFSTKGSARGLGTYSMKLLGERYLKGKVGFTTGQGGTVFYIKIPIVNVSNTYDNLN